MNSRGVSQIVSAVLLVAVATVAATGYYLWFTGLQTSTQTEIGENLKKSTLRHLNELSIHAIPAYYFSDRRFVQEIAVELENLGVCDYEGVQMKVMSVEALNGSVEWIALQLQDGDLLDINGGKAGSVECPKNSGIPFYRKDGTICGLNFDPSSRELLHNPTYPVGRISKGEGKEARAYLFINSSASGDILIRIYAYSKEGAEAQKLIRFVIE
jgi:FlaG/FlaF family flagellin (archaellin)